MENNKITVVVNEEIRDLMERTWLDYILKQDIIKGIINDYKSDEDDSILLAKVFNRLSRFSFLLSKISLLFSSSPIADNTATPASEFKLRGLPFLSTKP